MLAFGGSPCTRNRDADSTSTRRVLRRYLDDGDTHHAALSVVMVLDSWRRESTSMAQVNRIGALPDTHPQARQLSPCHTRVHRVRLSRRYSAASFTVSSLGGSVERICSRSRPAVSCACLPKDSRGAFAPPALLVMLTESRHHSPHSTESPVVSPSISRYVPASMPSWASLSPPNSSRSIFNSSSTSPGRTDVRWRPTYT